MIEAITLDERKARGRVLHDIRASQLEYGHQYCEYLEGEWEEGREPIGYLAYMVELVGMERAGSIGEQDNLVKITRRIISND